MQSSKQPAKRVKKTVISIADFREIYNFNQFLRTYEELPLSQSILSQPELEASISLFAQGTVNIFGEITLISSQDPFESGSRSRITEKNARSTYQRVQKNIERATAEGIHETLTKLLADRSSETISETPIPDNQESAFPPTTATMTSPEPPSAQPDSQLPSPISSTPARPPSTLSHDQDTPAYAHTLISGMNQMNAGMTQMNAGMDKMNAKFDELISLLRKDPAKEPSTTPAPPANLPPPVVDPPIVPTQTPETVYTRTNLDIGTVGYYWPGAPDDKCVEGSDNFAEKYTVVRDLETWISMVHTSMYNEQQGNQIRPFLWRLLRGDAKLWFQTQLTGIEQAALYDNEKALFAALRKKFGIKLAVAQQWMTQTTYTIATLTKKGVTTTALYATFRPYAIAMGDRTDHQLVTRFWQKLPPKLRALCPEPTDGTAISTNIDRIEQQRLILEESVQQASSIRTHRATAEPRKGYHVDEATEEEDHSDEDQANAYQDRSNRRPQRYPSRSFRPNRYEHKDRTPRPSHHEWRQNDRKQSTPYQHNNRTEWDRPQEKGEPFAGAFEYRRKQRFSDKFQRDNRHKQSFRRTWTKRQGSRDKYYQIQSDDSDPEARMQDLQDRGYHAVADQDEASAKDEANHYNGVDSYDDEQAEVAYHATATTTVKTNAPVVEAIARPGAMDLRESHVATHMRIPIRFMPQGESFEVCLDTGASNALVDKAWLQKHGNNPRFKNRPPKPVKGVKSSFNINETATFDFYMDASLPDRDILAHVTTTADVIEGLGPLLLLGNTFLYEHGAKVDYVKEKVTLRSVQNAELKARIFRAKQNTTMRKVRANFTSTIPPGSQAFISTSWSDPTTKHALSQSTAFHFTALHPAAYDSTIDKDTPELVIVHNRSSSPLQIKKHQLLGQIEQYDGYETALHIRNNENAHDVLHMAKPLANTTDDTTAMPLDTTKALPDSLDIPDVDNGTPNYGVSRPSDVPTITNAFGVRISDVEPEFAQQLRTLTDKFDIYHDRGLIPMADEEKMRIDLIDDWQNQKRNVRPYPLGLKDREALDKHHDELIAQGKLEPMMEPTPIACPAFVVWRTVNGKSKERIVIDLRPLNKMTVPDVYPLPDQGNIINSVRGNNYHSMFDGKSFYFQFGVYPPHRNRMVVISERGLEVSNVVLMGFRNAPAYVQRFMDNLFRAHASYIRVFIDDILISSRTKEDHLKHLEIFLRIATAKRLHVSPEKSFIAFPSIRLLGYIVDGKGITKTDDRLDAFAKLAVPSNLSELETFIGMAGFIRNGIPWYTTA